MSLTVAEWIVRAMGGWLAMGLLVGMPFVFRGVQRTDPAARDGTWGFRLLILPGVVALWPLMLSRWIRRAAPPVERNPHRGQR